MRKRHPHCPHCDCDLSGRVDARVSPRTVCPECGRSVSPTELVWTSQRARLDLVGDLPHLGRGLMWIAIRGAVLVVIWIAYLATMEAMARDVLSQGEVALQADMTLALRGGTGWFHLVAGTVAAMVMVFRLSRQAGIESWFLAGAAALVMVGAMSLAATMAGAAEPLRHIGWGQAVIAPGVYGTVAICVIMWLGEG